MDHTEKNTQTQIRNYLKALLFQLAKKSDNPSSELQTLLREVIDELHHDVQNELKNRPPRLKLVPTQKT